jgi:putative ABC transport system permease protein
MMYHFFKLSIRNLLKNRVFSLINIGGLALGLAACCIIGLYVYDEYSHDRFHQNFANIYRFTEIQEQADGIHPVAVTPGPLAATIEQDYPEVSATVRMGLWPALLQYNGTSLEPKSTMIVDPSMFRVFDFKLLAGNPNTALTNPDEVVLTASLAEQFFGADWQKKPVLGTVMTLNTDKFVTITGVVEDPPQKSHLQFGALLPFKFLEKYDKWSNKWNSNSYHTYLLLNPDTDVPAFSKKVETHLAKYNKGNNTLLKLQPLSDIYLRSKFDFNTDWGKRSDIFYLRIFLLVGIIVLLIAIVNFINLATARAGQRAMEVGVRKTAGAPRSSLVFQFLGESFFMTSLAVIVALILVESSIDFFKNITAKQLELPTDQPVFWALLAGVTVMVGFLAGIYPAFFLSGFRPSKVLKGVYEAKKGSQFRKTLVIGQFSLSVLLSISTVVIYQQLQFLQHKNLGFDQSQLLYLRLKGSSRDKSAVFKSELLQQPGVVSVSATTSNLVDVSNSTDITWEGQQPNDAFLITQMNIDPDFLKTTGMTLVSGRNYDPSLPTDTSSALSKFLLNETAAKRMGYTNESALGKRIQFWGMNGEVIGVLRDFHFRPLNKTIEPFVFRYNPENPYFQMLIKTAPNATPQVIEAMKKLYARIDPNNIISYGFVAQDLDAQYSLERRTGSTVLYFSVLAVLISCLGLFGLAAFMAVQRTREIGIRKVLGASVAGITRLFAADFLKLVFISIVIATPLAYYFMGKWLADFAYRIELQAWMFAAVGALVVVLALLTVSVQSVRAALADPVKSLRND